MTEYEIIATVIAGFALIQPWAMWVFKKIFRKIKVSFMPSAKIKLFYNRSGAYLLMGGVIESKNQNCVVKNISAKVIRQKDNAELKLDWSSFISPINQSVGNNFINTNENARPFKIVANELSPIFVELANEDENVNNRLFEIYNKITLDTDKMLKQNPNMNFDKTKEEFSKNSNYKKSKQELLEDFYWKESAYVVEFVIVYNNNRRIVYKYQFDINKKESASLKENIDTALNLELNRLYSMPYNFSCPQKEYVECQHSQKE